LKTQLEDIIRRLAPTSRLALEELGDYERLAVDGDGMRDIRLSVVIPVFNEEKTVARVICRVAALPLRTQIIIIDDASTDGTRAILQRLDGAEEVVLVLKEKNEGKGAALRDGFAMTDGDILVVQDADLEYDPRDLPSLIRPIVEDKADVVFGSRYIGNKPQDASWIHRLGNWALTSASNLFTGVRLTDMETCYKAFRREVLKDLTIRQNRFGVEPEITAKIARRGYRITEVPIHYHARGYDEGKKIGVIDLFKAIYCIARYGIAD
jgi:glycosyltransferase involved in cell wall biosynthesis